MAVKSSFFILHFKATCNSAYPYCEIPIPLPPLLNPGLSSKSLIPLHLPLNSKQIF